ncbi:MAG: hypothetical protein ACK4JF_03120 [Methylohalobius sp.]
MVLNADDRLPTGSHATTEPAPVRGLLIGVALLYLGLFLLLPLSAVFTEALSQGATTYLRSLQDPDARAAIRLTFLTATIAVPLNLVFGVAAAWCIAKFDFLGKGLLTTLIDLPFSVSPCGYRLAADLNAAKTISRRQTACLERAAVIGLW